MGDDTYGYAYDQIGNRIVTTESAETTEYVANNLNQYAQIYVPSVPSVVHPTHDLDGNQTLIRTSTGIWHVTYNAENRPVCFSNDTAVIEMAYDYQGRRFEYKETVNNTLARHERFLYRGYLQLAALNLLGGTNVLHTLVWDPTEPVGTRPLALQTQSGWFTYAFDQVKNVTELFDASGNIAAVYAYAPFGAVTAATGPVVAANPLTFSSEIADTSLGLQYYNFRHLNTLDGRWINRDPIGEKSFMMVTDPFYKNRNSQFFITINDIFKSFMLPTRDEWSGRRLKGLMNETLMINNGPVNEVDYLGLSALTDLLWPEAVRYSLFEEPGEHTDPEPNTCVAEGFYRHCVATCKTKKAVTFTLLGMPPTAWIAPYVGHAVAKVSARIIGQEMPIINQGLINNNYDAEDLLANDAGAEQAKDWFKSCKKGCKERFYQAVEDRCCPSDHRRRK